MPDLMDERYAFRELEEHLRLSQECAVIIGMHLQDQRWGQIAETFAGCLRAVRELRSGMQSGTLSNFNQ